MLARGGAGLGMSIPGGTGASALVAGRLALCLSCAGSWLVGGGRVCRSERGASGRRRSPRGGDTRGGVAGPGKERPHHRDHFILFLLASRRAQGSL